MSYKLITLSMMAYMFSAGDLPKLDLQVDQGSDFKAWRASVHEPLRTGGPRSGEASPGADPMLFM